MYSYTVFNEEILPQATKSNQIGKGSDGIVYKITLDSTDYALKYHPTDPFYVTLFTRENVNALFFGRSELEHIVPVLDAFVHEHELYTLMPLGIPLGKMRPEGEEEQHYVWMQMLACYENFYRNGWYHNDIKMDNMVWLPKDNGNAPKTLYDYKLCLIDFGRSTVTYTPFDTNITLPYRPYEFYRHSIHHELWERYNITKPFVEEYEHPNSHYFSLCASMFEVLTGDTVIPVTYFESEHDEWLVIKYVELEMEDRIKTILDNTPMSNRLRDELWAGLKPLKERRSFPDVYTSWTHQEIKEDVPVPISTEIKGEQRESIFEWLNRYGYSDAIHTGQTIIRLLDKYSLYRKMDKVSYEQLADWVFLSVFINREIHNYTSNNDNIYQSPQYKKTEDKDEIMEKLFVHMGLRVGADWWMPYIPYEGNIRNTIGKMFYHIIETTDDISSKPVTNQKLIKCMNPYMEQLTKNLATQQL
jgi:serine/threonine protein kinase